MVGFWVCIAFALAHSIMGAVLREQSMQTSAQAWCAAAMVIATLGEI